MTDSGNQASTSNITKAEQSAIPEPDLRTPGRHAPDLRVPEPRKPDLRVPELRIPAPRDGGDPWPGPGFAASEFAGPAPLVPGVWSPQLGIAPGYSDPASGYSATPSGLIAPDRSPGPGRRDFFRASGALGAVLVAGGLVHSATSARSSRLFAPDTTPTTADWNALKAKLSTHKLYRPGQSGYNFAKELFSPQYDSLKPSGVAYCKTEADVANCVAFVVKFKMPVRARSGGHSYGGWSSVTNGLILDITEMNSMSFGTNSVTVGTGIDLINFYSGIAAKGKAVPGGTCPTVGIAGLTMGGGVGALGRHYGLTCDNLTSLRVVTADGVTQKCDSGTNPNLYWASRGGGGSFGVATSFTFTTHDLSHLVLFSVGWSWSQAAKVVRGWQSWAPHAPGTVWSECGLGGGFGGAPSVFVAGSYVGSVANAKKEVENLIHAVGVSATIHATNYTYLGAMLHYAGCTNVPVHACDTPPGGSLPRVPFFAKSDIFTKPIDNAGISALVSAVERLRTTHGAAGGSGSIAFDALGGAINAKKPGETAFVHRDGLFLAQYYTSWTWPGSSSGVSNQRSWLNTLYGAVHPHASGQAYQNYADPTLTNWQTAYYGANYGRLSQTKLEYDPHQVFTFPQAIRPPAVVPCGDADPDC